DENLVDLETDKVVLEVPAPADGVLKEIRFETGSTVTSQQILAIIEEGAAAPSRAEAPVGAASGRDRTGDGPPTKAAGGAASVGAASSRDSAAKADTSSLSPGARFTAETNKI